ncbi:hypothetical protein HMF7854_01520 [Sphingomonas ginkgonis]|uniref:Uncharacterized protein n=1 Tax=Sphingomonas ginkgonis TaxID=2315330 RepID=A0A3R9WQX8_9SPHN|nr:hypothetical protein [Sphingomonas ginkgonis]RST29652.1 hypothetical protein HMF7854_01520 [Sphingomonas ginkgonis]
MIPLLLYVAVSSEMDSLQANVGQCDRRAVNPAFMGEAGRRSRFLLDAYRDQETIVAERLVLADRRRAQREGVAVSVDEDRKLKLQEAALDDRQKALNDRRMLEGYRENTMDSLRQFYLINCPVGEDKKK